MKADKNKEEEKKENEAPKEKENKNIFEGLLGNKKEDSSHAKAKEKTSKKKKEEEYEKKIEYTEKEREYINKYLPMARTAYDEKEIYEIIKKYNFNDEEINKDIKHQLEIISVKGEEYGWSEVKKKEIKPKTNNIDKKQSGPNKKNIKKQFDKNKKG